MQQRVVRSGPFGHPLSHRATTPPGDVAAVVAEVRSAQRRWGQRPVTERAAVLLRLHDVVMARRSEILDTIQREAGKSRADAFEEVADTCSVARHYARAGHSYLRPQRFRGIVPGVVGARVHRDPHGVVGVIAPWNYPLVLTLGELIPALLAGNGAVVKPDPLTTSTCRLALDLLAEAGVPDGLVAQVDGGADVGAALIEEVDHVLFTGSTVAGRAVAQQAAGRLIGATLELGGKNAAYVRADADVRLAVAGTVRGAFGNAGQLCLSTERLILHRDVAAHFLDGFLAATERLTLGNTLDFGYTTGSQISASQVEKVSSHVQDAVARGATVLTGGRGLPQIGPYVYPPTVLRDVPPSAHCFAEETFGPLVSVYVVDSDAEALALAQASGASSASGAPGNGHDGAAGLTASVWTRDVAAGRQFARRLPTGSVSLNENYLAVWGSTATPFGGIRASGSGRRHGPDAIAAVTRGQTVVEMRAARAGLGLSTLTDREGHQWTGLYTTWLKLLRGVGAS